MKKVLLSSCVAIAVFVPQSAYATDLDENFLPPPPVTGLRPATYDWSGFYVGAWAAPTCLHSTLKDNSPGGQTWANDGCGTQGGGLMGFNVQMDELVVGAEIDAGLSSILVTNPNPGQQYTFGMAYVASARARAGWAFDSTLLYITAGGVMGQGVFNAIPPATLPNNLRATEFGWTMGFGVEQAVTDFLRLRLEYDYTKMVPTTYLPAGGNLTVHWAGQHQLKAAAIFAF